VVTTLPFDREARTAYLKRVAAVLQRTQRRNQQARRSHFKTRRHQLHTLGLFTSHMRSCIPP